MSSSTICEYGRTLPARISGQSLISLGQLRTNYLSTAGGASELAFADRWGAGKIVCRAELNPMKPAPSDLIFFAAPAEFRKWLEQNHATAPALWVGYYKKDSGKPSMTWPESVDEALCF